jgi:hypothetical protein
VALGASHTLRMTGEATGITYSFQYGGETVEKIFYLRYNGINIAKKIGRNRL